MQTYSFRGPVNLVPEGMTHREFFLEPVLNKMRGGGSVQTERKPEVTATTPVVVATTTPVVVASTTKVPANPVSPATKEKILGLRKKYSDDDYSVYNSHGMCPFCRTPDVYLDDRIEDGKLLCWQCYKAHREVFPQ